MDVLNHRIRRPLFRTRRDHPALAGTPPEEGNWDYLGRLYQTRRYHPALAGAPTEDACMDAGGRAASGTKAEGNWKRLGGLFPALSGQLIYNVPLYHCYSHSGPPAAGRRTAALESRSSGP